MNIALFQNKYDEMAKRVLVDEYMKPTDEKETAFVERQVAISKINSMIDKIGLMKNVTPIVASQASNLSDEIRIETVIGYSLPDPVREDIIPFYYADKMPAYKEKELFTQNEKVETVDKIAQTVSWQRDLSSDDELLGVMEKAMELPQYRLLDDKDFNIVHDRKLLSMIKEGKTDFAVVSDEESFYVNWCIIEEALKNADLTADDIFGEIPDEYLLQIKENLESERTPNFNSKDGYYETLTYSHGKISDILDNISASELHLSFNLETQDAKDFGCYNRLFAVVADADGLQSLCRLPVFVNDETGELETLSDVCNKVQLYCSQINDDECWIKVADSDDIFNRAITDLSFEDDRRELHQMKITNFTTYEYNPVWQKEQTETLRATQSKMTCITMQDIEGLEMREMLNQNKNVQRD